MKRKGWPIWLLRDLPAFLGVMLSFWPLVILLISSERRVMRGKAIRRSVFETIALLLAHAEARLTFALTRQAYRRLGWNPRLVRFNLIPATYNLRDVQERYANYTNAFGDMNAVVEAYIEDIRQRYRIAERDLVAHGSTDARQSRAAHHELVGARARAHLRVRRFVAKRSESPEGRARLRARSRTSAQLNLPETKPTPPRTLRARERPAVPTCPAAAPHAPQST